MYVNLNGGLESVKLIQFTSGLTYLRLTLSLRWLLLWIELRPSVNGALGLVFAAFAI